MSIEEKTATSLSDYFKIIKEVSTDKRIMWFRGHASHRFSLAPSIYRSPYNAELEPDFMNLFKAKGVKFFPESKSYFEWLFLMQHYGTPTRLLDWSENATVALAFATQYRKKSESGDNAVIWCLDPLKVNEIANVTRGLSRPTLINICQDSEISKVYEGNGGKNSKPIAILGSYGSERIIAQKGVFTLFPKIEAFNMEEKEEAEQYLTKIIVPAEYVKEISKELYFVGVSEMSLFPEPESISKEIKRFYEMSTD